MAAAKEAFPAWSRTNPEERAKVLNKLADLIDANLEELAKAESRDQGASSFWGKRTLSLHSSDGGGGGGGAPAANYLII